MHEKIISKITDTIEYKKCTVEKSGDGFRLLAEITDKLPPLSILVQGGDVPEVDVEFGDVKKYISLGSIEQLDAYLGRLSIDIKNIASSPSNVRVAKRRILHIPFGGYRVVEPRGLSVLG